MHNRYTYTLRSLITTFFLLASITVVQGETARWSLYGETGLGTTGDDEGGLGDGPVFGGGVGISFSKRLQLQLAVSHQSNERASGPGQFLSDGNTLQFSSRVAYYFSESRLRPFLGVGLAWARYHGTSGFVNVSENPEPGSSSFPGMKKGTQYFLGPEVSAGLDLFLNRRVAIQPVFRLYLGGGGQYDPASDVIEPALLNTSCSVGIAYYW